MKTKIIRHLFSPKTVTTTIRLCHYSNGFFGDANTSKKNYYKYTVNQKLKNILIKSTELKQVIDSYQDEISPSFREVMYRQLRASWTYNSNAIEGSKLTLEDTIFLLEEGLTAEGKLFTDCLDTINHAHAVDFLYEYIASNREINTFLIKQINSIILGATSYIPVIDRLGRIINKPAHPGEYKKLPNHVLLPDGNIHKYVEPLLVGGQMDELFDWIQDNLESTHPVITAAIAHYNMVRIHPFDDGNGRCSRILMNTILLNKKYYPAIIIAKKRKEYLTSLREADKTGDVSKFVEFVGQSLITTQEFALQIIKEECKTGATPTNK